MSTQIIIALIAAAGGYAAAEIIKVLFPSKADQMNASQQLRDDLIKLRGDMQEQIRQTQKDLDEWKDKYYQLLEDYNEMHNSFNKLQKEYEHLQSKYENLKKKVDALKTRNS
jgi:predicted nuclease with TOPRIM domain